MRKAHASTMSMDWLHPPSPQLEECRDAINITDLWFAMYQVILQLDKQDAQYCSRKTRNSIVNMRRTAGDSTRNA